MPRPDRLVRALARGDHDRQPGRHRGHASPDRRQDHHPAGPSSAWASSRDSAAAYRGRLIGRQAWGHGLLADAARQGGLVPQRQAAVHAAGPCPEKRRRDCYQGAARRYDAQPVPGQLAIRLWNPAEAVGPATHRHHRDGASGPEEPSLGSMAVRPADLFVRRLPTDLLVFRQGHAVWWWRQAAPAPRASPKETATTRSTAPQAAQRSHRRAGLRPRPLPGRRRQSSWPRRWK